MKKSLAILVLFCFLANFVIATVPFPNGDELKSSEVNGIYKGKDIYFYTPTCKTLVDDERIMVKFQGKVIFETTEPRSFQVDLSKQGLVYGDELNIQVLYKGCKPFVVNDDAIEKRSSFKISDLHVSDTGLISFKTFNEIDKFPFIVQQYKWNKWVSVNKINGSGGEDWKAYTGKSFVTSGSNKFRVIRYNLWKPLTISEEYTFTSTKKVPSFIFDKKTKQVSFSSSTLFKVKNEFGENIMEGEGTNINLSEMSKGRYFIAYDNTYSDIVI